MNPIERFVSRIWAGLLTAAPPRFWAQIGAAMALTLFAGGLVLIIWKGPWTLAVEAARLDALAKIALALLGLILVALVAITELRVGISGGKDGFKADVEKDDGEGKPVATVITTTTTEIEAPASPAKETKP